MEDTLRAQYGASVQFTMQGLNPCFNGRYSQSPIQIQNKIGELVLILVLMEDTLRE